MSTYSYCMFMYLHRTSWHSPATQTEVFPCFLISCKTNARVKPAKLGHGPHSSKICVLFCVLFVCKCVLYYCHRVATQLQLTNISKGYILFRNLVYKVYPNRLYHQSHRLSANYNLQYTNTNENRSNISRFTFRPTNDMASPYKS